MQLQKGYVNDYVVIIFEHYINRCGGGRMRGNVTYASFFVRLVGWFLLPQPLYQEG